MLEEFQNTQIMKHKKSSKKKPEGMDNLQKQFNRITKNFKQFQIENYKKIDKIRKKVPQRQYKISNDINNEITMFKANLFQVQPRHISYQTMQNSSKSIGINEPIYKSDTRSLRSAQTVHNFNLSNNNLPMMHTIKISIETEMIRFQEHFYKIFSKIARQVIDTYKKVDSFNKYLGKLQYIQSLKENSLQKLKQSQTNRDHLKRQNEMIKQRQSILQQVIQQKDAEIQRISNQISIVQEKSARQSRERSIREKQLNNIIKSLKLDMLRQQQSAKAKQDSLIERIQDLQGLNKKRQLQAQNQSLSQVIRKMTNDQQNSKNEQINEQIINNLNQKIKNQQNQQFTLIQKLKKQGIQIEQLSKQVQQYSISEKKYKEILQEQEKQIKVSYDDYQKKEISYLEKLKNLEKQIFQKDNQTKQDYKKIISRIKGLFASKNIPGELSDKLFKIKKMASIYQTMDLSALFKLIFTYIDEIQNILIDFKKYQDTLKKSLEINFEISETSFEIIGYQQAIKNIKNAIDSKEEKIKQLESSNFAMQKQLKKNQLQSRKIAEKEPIVQDHSDLIERKSLKTPKNQIKAHERVIENNYEKQLDEKNQKIQSLLLLIEEKQQNQYKISQNYEQKLQRLSTQIRLLSDKLKDTQQLCESISQQNTTANEEKQKYLMKNKQLKIQIESCNKIIKNKQISYLKDTMQLNNKIKKQESTITILKRSEQNHKQEIQANLNQYEQNLSKKQKMIDQLLNTRSILSAENKIMKEKLKNNQDNANVEKLRPKESQLFITHPKSLVIKIQNNGEVDIKKIQQELENYQETNLALELDKRKLTRKISQLQKAVTKIEVSQATVKQNKIIIEQLNEEILHQQKIRLSLQTRLRLLEAKKFNEQGQNQINLLKEQLKKKEVEYQQESKQRKTKQQQLLKTIKNLQEQNQAKLLEVQAELEKKQQQLKIYIEKYNNAKVQLINQLDGKSDYLNEVKFENQNHIALLKEQIQILEARLQQKQEIKKQPYSIEQKQGQMQVKSINSSLSIQEISQNYEDNGAYQKNNQQPKEKSKRQERRTKKYESDEEDNEDDEQLADHVGDLDIYSPLEKRIIIQSNDEDVPIKLEGGFSLGLMQIMGDDQNPNQEVYSPDDED